MSALRPCSLLGSRASIRGTQPQFHRLVTCATAAREGSATSGFEGFGQYERKRSPSGGRGGRGGGRGGAGGRPSRVRTSGGRGGRGGRGQAQKEGPNLGQSKYPPHIMRLNKTLATHGVASRRASEALIEESRVKVNGKVVRDPAHLVNTKRDEVEVEGRGKLKLGTTEYYYFAVNKPKGYICSNAPSEGFEGNAKLVVELLEPWIEGYRKREKASKGARPAPRLYSVGRLDVNSSGLIFVTNDGAWAQQVSHPSAGLTKEYVVTTDVAPTKQQLETIAAGGMVDGAFVQPVAVGPASSAPDQANRTRIIVNEGRNREVRTLVAYAGLEVRGLKRIRVGGFKLPADLGLGGYRQLRPHEVRRVTNLGSQKTLLMEIGYE
ncbi:unnamed protein product [Pedinophyceae sp. YPF-701]|nr:unnamed protein product [Pedinophyceae sp. YPF-701]